MNNKILEKGKYYYLDRPLGVGLVSSFGYNIFNHLTQKQMDEVSDIRYKMPLFVKKIEIEAEQDKDEWIEVESNKEHLHLGYGEIEIEFELGGCLEFYDFEGSLVHDGEFIEITGRDEIILAMRDIWLYNTDPNYKKLWVEERSELLQRIEKEVDANILRFEIDSSKQDLDELGISFAREAEKINPRYVGDFLFGTFSTMNKDERVTFIENANRYAEFRDDFDKREAQRANNLNTIEDIL